MMTRGDLLTDDDSIFVPLERLDNALRYWRWSIVVIVVFARSRGDKLTGMDQQHS